MRVHIFLPFVATSALLGLCCEQALATQVTVISSRGSVSVTQAEHLVSVSASTRLTLPAQIRTGSDGMVDLKDNDSLVHIGPNSTVALPDTGPSGSLVDRYLQSAGSALYNIQSRHGRPMSVETPYLVSVVKGTVFTIAVEEGATSVTLMEGALDVSAPGVNQHVLLKPNQSIRHSLGERSLVVSPVGARPENLKGGTAEVEAPVTDELRAAQFALVTRDLAEVGATVSAQHVLSNAYGAHGSATAHVAGAGSTSASSGNGSSNASLSPSGSGNGTSTGTTPGASNTAVTTSSNTTNVTGSGTSASSNASSSPSGSSNSTSAGATSGASGSPTSGSTATSGSTSNSGSSSNTGSNDDESASKRVGCNGKSNGTGLGQCLGHGKPKH